MNPILTPSILRRALNLLQDQAHETGEKTRQYTAGEVWLAVKDTRKPVKSELAEVLAG